MFGPSWTSEDDSGDVWRFVWSAATQKETRQESEYEGRQKWTSLFFLGDKQQWIFPTRPDRTRLNQTGPGFTRSNQTRARSMKQVLTGPNRTTHTDQNMVTLCYTLRHRGNSHTWLAQSGLVGPGPIISPVPLLQTSEGSEGGSIESGETKKLIGPQTVKPRPPIVTPGHPIGCLHLSQKQSEPFSHWSPQPQAGKAVFFPHWSVLTRQLSVTQQRPIRLQYLWNFLE